MDEQTPTPKLTTLEQPSTVASSGLVDGTAGQAYQALPGQGAQAGVVLPEAQDLGVDAGSLFANETHKTTKEPRSVAIKHILSLSFKIIIVITLLIGMYMFAVSRNVKDISQFSSGSSLPELKDPYSVGVGSNKTLRVGVVSKFDKDINVLGQASIAGNLTIKGTINGYTVEDFLADAVAGENGADGAAGADGTDGLDGANGADGNSCGTGVCVSLQGSTPGLQEAGNLNISGTVMSASARFTGLASCDTIDTDASGNLSCGTDAGATSGFMQGGNSFGSTAVLGTNDSNSLTFETNNLTQATVAVGGAATFQNTTNSTSAFQVLDSAAADILLVDTLNRKVAFGDSTPGSTNGQVQIISSVSTGRVSLVLQEASGQTGNMFETRDSGGGNIRALIDVNGGAVFNEQGLAAADFRVEGDTNVNLLFIDASADSIGIGDASPAYLLTVGSGDLFGVDSSANLIFEGSADAFETTITVANAAADRTYTIPDSTGNATDTFCLFTLNNCAGGATTTLQQTYNNDADGSDAVIGLTAADGAVVIRDNASPLGSTLFAVQNSAGSTNYLRVQASGVSSDVSLTLGTNQTLNLTGGTTANRPGSPTEGMIYFDTDTDSLLTYANGKWQATIGEYIIVAANDSSQAEKDAAHYVADGTADQTEINNALTAAGGGKVFLAAGTYVTSGTILVPNNTVLSGAGKGTLIQFNVGAATDNAIENSDTTTGTGVVVRDLRLLDTGSPGNQTGIAFTGMGVVIGTARAGAQVLDAWVQGFNVGVGLDASQGNVIRGVTATGNLTYGFAVNNSSTDNTLTNNVATDNSSGFYIGGSSWDNTLTGNIGSENVANGIIAGSGVSITSNTFNNNGQYGINLSYGGGSTVSGNVIDYNGNQGIAIDNGSADNVITGNFIYLFNSGVTSGIYTNNGDTNNITGNHIAGGGGSGYAINISDVASSGNYLAGNTYSGTGATSINDTGTGTIYAGQLSSTNDFTLQGVNNVSIGTLSSDAKLEVLQSSTSITAGTLKGGELTVTGTGIVTSGTDTTYGQVINVTRTGATGGTINTYGLDIQATGDTGGTSTLTGLNVNVSGADTNYAAIFQGGNVGIGTAIPGYRLDVSAAAVASNVESIANFAVSDSTGYIRIENNSTTDTGFSGKITGLGTGANIGLNLFSRLSSDTGVEAGIKLDVRTSVGGAISTRPLLDITNNATSRLQVTAAGSLAFQQASTISTTAGALTLQPVAGSNVNITTSGAGDLAVNTNQLYVDSSTGNVGIGDTTPDAKLDIDYTSTSSTAGTEIASGINLSDTGVVTTGTDTTTGESTVVVRSGSTGGTVTTYGEDTSVTQSASGGTTNTYGQSITLSNTVTGGATGNAYGLDIQATTSDTASTSTLYGIRVAVSGADTNYAATFTGGSVGIGTAAPNATFNVQNTSTTAVRFQQASSGTSLFLADTTNMKVQIGSGTPVLGASTTGGLYVTDTAEFAGRVLIGTTTNGIDTNSGQARFTGTYRNDGKVTLKPEFEGATFRGDGGSNIGILSSSFCSNEGSLSINTGVCGAGQDHSYYEWSHGEASAQDYDIVTRMQLPSDFDSSVAWSTHVTVNIWAWRTDGTNNAVTANIYNDAGALCGTADMSLATGTAAWTQTSYTGFGSDTDCDGIDAGEYFTVVIHVNADTSDTVRLGEIELNYKGTF